MIAAASKTVVVAHAFIIDLNPLQLASRKQNMATTVTLRGDTRSRRLPSLALIKCSALSGEGHISRSASSLVDRQTALEADNANLVTPR